MDRKNLADNRLKNVTVIEIDGEDLTSTLQRVVNAGGNYLQVQMFSSNADSGIYLAFDNPSNEIKVFNGLKINRPFRSLFMRRDTIGNNSKIFLYVGENNEVNHFHNPEYYTVKKSINSLASASSYSYTLFSAGKKVLFDLVCLSGFNYDLTITANNENADSITIASFTEIANDRFRIEIDSRLYENLNFTITNRYASAVNFYAQFLIE